MSQQPETVAHWKAEAQAAQEHIEILRAQVERLQAACRSQTAEYDSQAGLSLTGATQEAADIGADVDAGMVPLTTAQVSEVCSGIFLSDHPHGSSSYDQALADALTTALARINGLTVGGSNGGGA